jgi:hypothetical protein
MFCFFTFSDNINFKLEGQSHETVDEIWSWGISLGSSNLSVVKRQLRLRLLNMNCFLVLSDSFKNCDFSKI